VEERPDFELTNPLPEWKERGIGDDMAGCIRVDPALHRTIGFFVAVFERRSSDQPPLKRRKKKKKKKRKKKKIATTIG